MKTNWENLTKDQLVRRLKAAERITECMAEKSSASAVKEQDREWRRCDESVARSYEFALKLLREDPDDWKVDETERAIG